MPDKIRKVILVIEDSSAYCRSLIMGISRYSQVHGPWAIYRDIHNSSYRHSRNLRKEFYDHLNNIDSDGIISRSPSVTRNITKRGVPTIIAITEPKVPDYLPRIEIDHLAVGQMAAQYYIEKGYKNFAFYGNTRYYWTRQRYKGFKQALNQVGLDDVECYDHPSNTMIINKGFNFKIRHLSQWLKTLRKPTAILASSDAWAVPLIEASKTLEVHIPEEVALLGVDNDEPICNICSPLLSSIALNGEQGGFKVAQLLDNLMKGEKMQGQRIYVKPIHVVTRTSTDILAVEDLDIAKAIQFIRTNRQVPIQITDIAEHVSVSLRTLQNKFREKLNRTLLEEVKSIRINYAKELLLNSEMNISEISDYMHFSGVNAFSRYFKDTTGHSPIDFKKQYGKY